MLSVKRGKRNGVANVVVDQAMLRGSHRGLGLAGHSPLHKVRGKKIPALNFRAQAL